MFLFIEYKINNRKKIKPFNYNRLTFSVNNERQRYLKYGNFIAATIVA